MMTARTSPAREESQGSLSLPWSTASSNEHLYALTSLKSTGNLNAQAARPAMFQRPLPLSYAALAAWDSPSWVTVFFTVRTLPLTTQVSLNSTTVSPAGDGNDRRDVMTSTAPSNLASPFSVIPSGASTLTLLPSSL